jgi:hypothetical protein
MSVNTDFLQPEWRGFNSQQGYGFTLPTTSTQLSGLRLALLSPNRESAHFTVVQWTFTCMRLYDLKVWCADTMSNSTLYLHSWSYSPNGITTRLNRGTEVRSQAGVTSRPCLGTNHSPSLFTGYWKSLSPGKSNRGARVAILGQD